MRNILGKRASFPAFCCLLVAISNLTTEAASRSPLSPNIIRTEKALPTATATLEGPITVPVENSGSSSSSSSKSSTSSSSSSSSSSTSSHGKGVGNVLERRPSVDAGLRYSSQDWVVNLLTTPFSYILRRIRYHLVFNMFVCLAVMYFYDQRPGISIPMTGHTLLASSLGLLVSFRTNSAYSRFWEARTHWTNTKAICRSLAVMVKSHLEEQSPKATALFMEQLAAYPSTLMHLCLGGAAKLPDYAQRFLPLSPDGYQEKPAFPAIYLCRQLQQTLHMAMHESKTVKWNLVEAAHMNEASDLIALLLENMSSCEKILRTPVPWTYSRHTSRFLTLYLTTLPFALVGSMSHRWLVLAISFVASYCLLGIEEIGHLIEQPFMGDPLDGQERIWSSLDDDGEASALIKRGKTTQPYDIGIPVCSLAAEIRSQIEDIANGGGLTPAQYYSPY